MLSPFDYERRALPEFDLVLHGRFDLGDLASRLPAIGARLEALRREAGLPPLTQCLVPTRLWDDAESFLIPGLTPPHDSLTLVPAEAGCELQVPSWGFLRRRRREDERYLAFVLACTQCIWQELGATELAFGISGAAHPTSAWFALADAAAWGRELALYLVAFHVSCRSTLAQDEVRRLVGAS